MKNIKMMLFIFVLLACSGIANSAVYEYPIYSRYPQITGYFCGQAVAQNWIKALTGFSRNQFALANSVPTSYWNTNSGEMAEMLNNFAGYTAGYNRVFYYSDAWSQDNAEGGVAVNLMYGRRTAIPANVVDPSGNVTQIGGHWLLIYAADVSPGYNLNWVKVLDPLQNSAFASNYSVISYGNKVYNSVFFDTNNPRWSPLSHGAYQYVVHTN